jgi:predicted O-methyltransferase YrrM
VNSFLFSVDGARVFIAGTLGDRSAQGSRMTRSGVGDQVKSLLKRRLPAPVLNALRKAAIKKKIVRSEGNSWIGSNLRFQHPRKLSAFDVIERLAAETQAVGPQPLWSGYGEPGSAARTSEEVRTSTTIGKFFTFLAIERRPQLIVEFGTAFGVSGMYWLAGLEENGAGRLLTFEPNSVWAEIARRNLASVSSRFELIPGTFEANLDAVTQPIDIAYIDAIHTSEFVIPQLDLVVARSAPGALVVLDDIEFSQDMRDCWQKACTHRDVIAAAQLGPVGILEVRA